MAPAGHIIDGAEGDTVKVSVEIKVGALTPKPPVKGNDDSMATEGKYKECVSKGSVVNLT